MSAAITTAYVDVEGTKDHPVEVIVTAIGEYTDYGWRCPQCGIRVHNLGRDLPTVPVNGVLPRWTLAEDTAREHSEHARFPVQSWE